MSEPIAVAFVEVRPETDEFRTDTERELAGIGDDFSIRGDVRLDGLDAARVDVDRLRQGLGELSGQQLQFEGLEDATADTERLRQSLSDVAAVNLAAPVDEFTSAVDKVAGTSALSDVTSDAAAAAGAIATAADELGGVADASSQTADSAVGASTALAEAGLASQQFGAAAAEAGKVATGGMAAATAATLQEANATRQATIEEEKLLRVRSRRASSVGAFRFAGVGLLAGSALFGATQALGALRDGLEVTGNEATTTVGKLRNVGANLLGGDFVGAFKALTNETRTFDRAQLEMLHHTPQAEAALNALGRAGDIAKSRLEGLAAVAQNPIPQFIQTQIAEARLSGDPNALREALERGSKAVDEALEEAKRLRPNQKALGNEIKSRREELAQVREELARLQDDPGAGRGRIDIRTGRFFSPLDDLRKREQQLVEEMNTFARSQGQVTPAFNAAAEALANAKREQKEAIDEARAAAAEDILAPLAEAVTDARLTGSATAILAALKAEAAGLRQIIDGFEGSADDRVKFKDDLLALNRTIEATQKAIKDEAERHRQAMIDNALAPSEEAVLDAELADVSRIPALQGRAGDIEEILRTGLIGGKKISRDQRVALKNELSGVHSQIESEQEAIAAENKRHADAMQDKLDTADDDFVRALGGRENQLRNQQAIEQAKAGFAGDIRVSNELQAFFKASIDRARKTINDARLRNETVAELRAELAREVQNEGALRQQQRAERRDRQAEKLDLSIEIASSNENRAAEIRARNAKIAFLRAQIDSTRRGSVERKRLRAEIAAERAAIRDLKKAKDENDAASATTLADLFTKQVEINRDRSVGQPLLAPKIGDVTQPIEDRVQRQIRAQADVSVKSPFETTGDKIATSNEKLTAALERLIQTIPNLTGVTGGPPPSRGDVVGMRGEAMAQAWSRRAKQIAQESASA